jgi:HSP20 family protein
MQKSLMNRSSDLLEDFFKDFPGFYIRPLHGESNAPGPIRLDVKDTESQYIIQAELPGASKEDIEVSIDGNRVTVKAEIKQEEIQKNESWLRTERYHGVTSRSLSLPIEVSQKDAKAHYEKGLLTLTLPKKSQGEQLRLKID